MSVDDERQPDAELARALRAAGRRSQPSARQLEQWQRHFAAELAARPRQQSARYSWWLAAAASVAAVVAAVLLWPAASSPPAATVAEVVTVFGGAVVRHDDAVDPLAAGDRVRDGQRVEVGLRSGLGVRMAGYDVRLAANSTATFGTNTIRLEAGSVYVDAGNVRGHALEVLTPAGAFEHVGTQYLVRVHGSEVLGAVREGSIVLHRGAGDDVALSAGAGSARLVRVGAGELETADVPASGELWDWTEQLSEGFAVRGATADQALRWAARERGQRLVYATDAAAKVARSAELGGGGSPQPADQVLRAVNAGTTLRVVADPDAGVITVTLDSEADADAD